MYFRYKRQDNTLKVDNFFATLKKIDNDENLFFDFTYSVSQSYAFKHKALTVELSLFSQVLTREKVLTNVVKRGNIDVKKLIDKSRSQITAAKTVKKEQDTYLLARRRSDITSYVNNAIVGKLNAGVDPRNIEELYKKKLALVDLDELKKKNDDKPVLTHATPSAIYDSVDLATSASLDINAKFHRLEMLNKGKDPSHIADMSHLSVSAQDAIQGTLRRQKTNDTDYSSQAQLLNSLIFSADNFRTENTTNVLQHGQKTHVLTTETQDELTIPISVVIPKSSRKLPGGKEVTVVYVEYRLINSTSGEVIDVVTKTVDLAKHIQFYMTPKFAPNVKASVSSLTSRVNLEVKQTSPNATAISVYKKNFNKSVTTTEDYTLIGTYRLDVDDKPFTLSVDKPKNSIAIYRVISIGKTGILGFDYANVVIAPNKIQYKNSIAVTLLPIENGINIEVGEIPQNVTAIQPVVRNLTTFEKEFSNVSAPILVDDSIRISDHITITDSNVVDDNTYEYAFRLFQRSGTTELTGNTVISYVAVQPGKIDIQLTNVSIVHNPNPDVRFNVSFELGDTTVGILHDMLDRDDISKFFDRDVQREREFLKGLIAHNVQRVDLTTGDRVDFGVLINSDFSDKTLGDKNSITPLETGHKYRYEIYTLIRSPETMFESLRKSKVDPVTKKPYTFSPAKFLHPVVLKRGVIVSAIGLKSRYGQDQMFYGSIGLTKTIDVTFDKDPAQVIDVNVTRVSKDYNALSWRLDGDVSLIDHFIVMKEINGIRTIVGKAHSEFPYGNCNVYHKLTGRDMGELMYVIVPVLNTYDTGPIVKSNVVNVED